MSEADPLRAPLGRTGRTVFRLGVASSFGVGGRDLEAAVEEHGVDYLYWGSLRTRAFGDAVRALCTRGLRDRLFLVVQSYSRVGCLVRPSLRRALKRLGTDRADLLLLGWWNGPVRQGILDAALACQEQGLTRHLGVSTHTRTQVPDLARPGSPFDVVHLRYNAVHPGAERDVFPHLEGEPSQRAGLVAFTATSWAQLLRPVPGAPPGQRVPSAGDCYRFVLARPEVSVCMSGPRSGDDLRAALAEVQRGPMDADELAWMRDVGQRIYGAPRRRKLFERI